MLRTIFKIRRLDKRTRKLLHDKFNVSGYWYPLHGDVKPNDVEYFETHVFSDRYGIQKIINLIGQLGDKIINEIPEVGNDRKISVDNFDSDSDETFYCNDNVDWLIYCSHEKTITIGGKTLLDKLKADWHDWDKYKNPWQDTHSGSA